MLNKNFSISQGQQYYFQFIPTQIKIKNQSIAKKISNQTKFKFKLFKGIQKTSQTNFIPATIFNNSINIENESMSFSLPSYLIDKNIQFTLKLIKDQQEIGQAKITVKEYVTNFKNNQHCTEEQFQLFTNSKQSQFSIDLQIFVNKSRYNLEKSVKSKKIQSLANSRQVSIKSYNNVENKIQRSESRKKIDQDLAIRRSNIIMRSEVLSHSSQGKKSYASYNNQQDRFMPNKKYVRKPSGERKLLLKSNRTNSQKSNSQQDGKEFSQNSRDCQNKMFMKKLSPKNPYHSSQYKDAGNMVAKRTINFNNSSLKRFYLQNSSDLEKKNQPNQIHDKYNNGKYKIEANKEQNHQVPNKYNFKIDYQNNRKFSRQNLFELTNKQKKDSQFSKKSLIKKSKADIQKAEKKISFVQRTNSLLINNDQQMQEHKIKLTQSFKNNNIFSINLSNSSKLKKLDERSEKGSEKSVKVNTNNRSRRNSIIHTMKQSRNSKLQKQLSKQKVEQIIKENVKDEKKSKIILFIFIIISLLLVYQVMSPTKKYYSRKKKERY